MQNARSFSMVRHEQGSAESTTLFGSEKEDDPAPQRAAREGEKTVREGIETAGKRAMSSVSRRRETGEVVAGTVSKVSAVGGRAAVGDGSGLALAAAAAATGDRRRHIAQYCDRRRRAQARRKNTAGEATGEGFRGGWRAAAGDPPRGRPVKYPRRRSQDLPHHPRRYRRS